MRRREKRREFLALWVEFFGDGDALRRIGDAGDLFRRIGATLSRPSGGTKR